MCPCPDPPVKRHCRDIGREADDMGNILDTTHFAPYLTHDKGLHSRKLNLVD